MELTVAALVGFDKNERMEVRLPGLSTRAFRGPSVAELLDDAALHLMEQVPRWSPERLQRLVLNPKVCLRTVKVELDLPFRAGKKHPVKQRLTVYCEKWPREAFWIVRVPRLGDRAFAVPGLHLLPEGLSHWLGDWAKDHGSHELEAAKPLRDEHLMLFDVDLELPSILPSKKPKRVQQKRKKGEPAPAKKKTWVPAYELKKVGVNLLHRALDQRLRPALGRDALVDDLLLQLQRDGSAILLVGERGVGKTAIVEAVAQRLAARNDGLKERTVLWRVDGGRLLAGMSMVGQWEARLSRVVEEIHQRDDVLVVDDLPSLAWVGRSAQSDTTMSGYLTPHLERDELRILGECTPERLEAGRLVDPGFFAYFRIIRVPVLNRQQTYQVLLAQARQAEASRNLVSSPGLFQNLLQLARRFGPRMVEPGRSVSLAQRFYGEVVGTKQDRFGRVQVTEAHLQAHLVAETGLPDFVLTPGQARPAAQIQGWFAEHIVGQPTAIGCVTDVVCTLQQGLDDPERPIATLLFVGPTGVGKTETAKALAAYLFGDVNKLLRFDMSEVQGPGAVQRLVGGGARVDGELTRAVSNSPFSVVLLDEIEKAGPQVFDLLLQVLGEGRLTNAAGQTTDFRNTVVIMTSNLGAGTGRRRSGFDRHSVQSDATHYRSAAEGFFRPEFFNRIDRIVPFRSLDVADVEPLVQRIVSRVVGRRGLRSAGVIVRLDARIRAHLADAGFDPQYGARSLQRLVEQELTVPLARVLVDRPPGDAGLFLDVHRDEHTQITAVSLEAAPLIEGLGLLTDWPDLAQQHQHLLDQVMALRESVPFEGIETERTELLGRTGAGLDDDGWDELGAATAVVEGRSTLLSDLEDYATDRLAAYVFLEAHAYADVGRNKRGFNPPRKQIVGQPRVEQVDRKRTLGAASRELLALELRVAELLHRVHSHGDLRTLVLRFEPMHDEGGPLAVTLAKRFQECWASWGRSETWRYSEAWQVGDLEPGRVAVVLTVPGLHRLMRPFAGLYLRGAELGAERRLSLVRLDVLEGDPKTLLNQPPDVVFPPVLFRFGSLREGGPKLPLLATHLRRLALLPLVR